MQHRGRGRARRSATPLVCQELPTTSHISKVIFQRYVAPFRLVMPCAEESTMSPSNTAACTEMESIQRPRSLLGSIGEFGGLGPLEAEARTRTVVRRPVSHTVLFETARDIAWRSIQGVFTSLMFTLSFIGRRSWTSFRGLSSTMLTPLTTGPTGSDHAGSSGPCNQDSPQLTESQANDTAPVTDQ